MDKHIGAHQQQVESSVLHLSAILLGWQVEESQGFDLQGKLDETESGGIIELPAEKIVIEELYIKRPVTIVGKPGTLISVQGAGIIVDFRLDKGE
jgi:hypothetical protein